VIARLVAQAYPTDAAPNQAAGILYLQLGEFAHARAYLERSFRAKPDERATLAALVRANLGLEDAQRARTHLAALKRVAPRHPLVRRLTPSQFRDVE
jgi:Tfp pilus assembly protein PilF